MTVTVAWHRKEEVGNVSPDLATSTLMTQRLSGSLGFLFFLWVAACGSGLNEEGGDIDASPIPEASYADAVARALCEALDACECSEHSFIGKRTSYSNADACQYEESIALETFVADAREAGLTYDETCAGEQVQRLEQRSCDWSRELVFDCNPCPVVHGDKPVGVACERLSGNPAYSDCARGLTCSLQNPRDAFSGLVCVEACPTAVQLGESCRDEAVGPFGERPCVENAYCLRGVCTERAQVGDACRDDFLCTSSAFCDGDTVDADGLDVEGTCVEKVAVGEACRANVECAVGLCLEGVSGDSERRCRAIGEPCVADNGDGLEFSCTDDGWAEVPGVCTNRLTPALYPTVPL